MEIDLIKTLKEEHQIIVGIFGEIDSTSDLESKKILIKKLLEVINPHLKKENEELYPALEKSKDEEVIRMAKIFSVTMKGYAEEFVVVIEKMLALTGEIPEDVKVDYKKICERLKDRITIEEVTIFPEYEKTIREQGVEG